MKYRTKFSGTGVAIVTPFRKGKIDFDSLGQIIEHVINGGVEYIVSLGTTGEAITLTTEECQQIFKFTIKQTNGRVPLVAGLFGTNSPHIFETRFKNYPLEGFDAILSSSPAYNKPQQEGIYQHYMELAKQSPLPIIIYNVPGRTASNISAKTIVRLAESSEKFIAVKEASGNLVQCMDIIKNKPEHFQVLSGDDQLTLPLMAAGGEGVISVIANAYPKEFSSMVRACLDNDYATARKLNNQILDVHPWLYVENNPVGIKAAMEILELSTKEVRLPLVPMGKENYKSLKAAMEKAK